MSIFHDAGRFIDHAAKSVTRTAKKVPGLGFVIHKGEDVGRGPVGDTLKKVLANPVVQTVAGRYVVPAHLLTAALDDGVEGVKQAAKEEIRNPVRRVVLKGIGYIFPPAAAASDALDASNKALDAAEHPDPATAAKAAAQIGITEALAESGDVDAQKMVGALSQARAARAELSKVPVRDLTHLWIRDNAGRNILGDEASHAASRPALLRNALNVLHVASRPGYGGDPAKTTAAAGIVGRAIGLGQSHPGSPFLVFAGKAAHDDMQRIASSKDVHSKAIMGEVERNIMAHSAHRTSVLNSLLFALNGRHGPQAALAAKAHVDSMHAAASHGDITAKAAALELKKRAAALKKAGEYVIDRHGSVAHRGPKLS